jgi:hypothetical protein
LAALQQRHALLGLPKKSSVVVTPTFSKIVSMTFPLAKTPNPIIGRGAIVRFDLTVAVVLSHRSEPLEFSDSSGTKPTVPVRARAKERAASM